MNPRLAFEKKNKFKATFRSWFETCNTITHFVSCLISFVMKPLPITNGTTFGDFFPISGTITPLIVWAVTYNLVFPVILKRIKL